MTRARAAALGLALAACTLSIPALAQPAATPRGIVGRGEISLDMVNPKGGKMGFAGRMSFEQRDDAFRLDVTSFTLINPAGTSVELAPGGLTMVVDRRRQRFVIWSTARRTYFWGDLPKPSLPLAATTPEQTPEPAPSGSPRPRRNRNFSPFAGAKDLKVFSIAIDMSGHGTTNGHPSTGFTYRWHTESNDGKVNDLNGVLQTADDLSGMPVQFTLNVALQSGFTGALRADITSFEKRDPPKLDFLVPVGYKAAQSPLEVVAPNFKM